MNIQLHAACLDSISKNKSARKGAFVFLWETMLSEGMSVCMRCIRTSVESSYIFDVHQSVPGIPVVIEDHSDRRWAHPYPKKTPGSASQIPRCLQRGSTRWTSILNGDKESLFAQPSQCAHTHDLYDSKERGDTTSRCRLNQRAYEKTISSDGAPSWWRIRREGDSVHCVAAVDFSTFFLQNSCEKFRVQSILSDRNDESEWG